MNTEDIARADHARAILADELMVEAQKHIEAEFYRLFKTLHPTDVEGLTQLKGMQYLHEKYLTFLNSVITQGKLAVLELNRTRPRPSGY
jgi:hypothetical protein